MKLFDLLMLGNANEKSDEEKYMVLISLSASSEVPVIFPSYVTGTPVKCTPVMPDDSGYAYTMASKDANEARIKFYVRSGFNITVDYQEYCELTYTGFSNVYGKQYALILHRPQSRVTFTVKA